MSDKHKLLFTQRKAEFLQDFGENVSALEEAEKEVEHIIKLKIIAVNRCRACSKILMRFCKNISRLFLSCCKIIKLLFEREKENTFRAAAAQSRKIIFYNL